MTAWIGQRVDSDSAVPGVGHPAGCGSVVDDGQSAAALGELAALIACRKRPVVGIGDRDVSPAVAGNHLQAQRPGVRRPFAQRAGGVDGKGHITGKDGPKPTPTPTPTDSGPKPSPSVTSPEPSDSTTSGWEPSSPVSDAPAASPVTKQPHFTA